MLYFYILKTYHINPVIIQFRMIFLTVKALYYMNKKKIDNN